LFSGLFFLLFSFSQQPKEQDGGPRLSPGSLHQGFSSWNSPLTAVFPSTVGRNFQAKRVSLAFPILFFFLSLSHSSEAGLLCFFRTQVLRGPVGSRFLSNPPPFHQPFFFFSLRPPFPFRALKSCVAHPTYVFFFSFDGVVKPFYFSSPEFYRFPFFSLTLRAVSFVCNSVFFSLES